MICVIVGYPFRSVKPRYEEHGTALKGLLAEGILDQNGAEVSLVPAKPAIDVRSLPLSKSYKVRVLWGICKMCMPLTYLLLGRLHSLGHLGWVFERISQLLCLLVLVTRCLWAASLNIHNQSENLLCWGHPQFGKYKPDSWHLQWNNYPTARSCGELDIFGFLNSTHFMTLLPGETGTDTPAQI